MSLTPHKSRKKNSHQLINTFIPETPKPWLQYFTKKKLC